MFKLVVDGFHYETETLQELVGYITQDYPNLGWKCIKCVANGNLQELKELLVNNGFKVQ